MDADKKMFAGWFWWVFLMLVASGVIMAAIGYGHLFVNTIVERKVFESSYQYQEARKSAVSTFEAQLVELNHKLENPNLDSDTRTNLEAQVSAINIQLAAERSRQK